MRDTANGGMVAAEDVAQDLTLYVWEHIGDLSNPAAIYPWLNTIAFRNGKRSAQTAKDDSTAIVPLQIESEDDPDELIDNPLLHRRGRLTYGRAIPSFIQGHDRLICDYIRDGLNYKQIGVILVMTETAIKKRVAEMRKKVEASKQSMRAAT
jgi:DNA-directed RNA polymerase specialized sigma24 family protein